MKKIGGNKFSRKFPYNFGKLLRELEKILRCWKILTEN